MSSTDDSEEDGPEFSGIIQPPLIHQLKSILDQYPDDGQILKEIIQNAEDAEASEMKVLFDERCVNKEDGTKRRAFKKYFKGPALCVFNSASFTEADWTGIQMIYQSVKEFDPVKVGRFGLGFKSVFHITDYPMIISGGKLLVIDPHQKDPGKVCITMKLNKLHKYKKQMEPSYCLNAFDGLFGFSQETLDTGNFHGTLFRFPLRHDVSPLSDNIYGREKISDLFTAFQSEASVELLFLKCLEKIELFWKTGDDRRSDDPFFMVKIADNCLADVRIKRSELQSYMRQVLLSVTEETYIRTFDLTIVTQNATEESIEQDWFVMHCRKGKPLSDELIKLSQDESLSYSPYVSIAVPLFVDPQFIGHVFCLMPLPLETKSLTGYPVHVNGLFALDQNRRHVKWPSADQTKNKTHTDKPTRWNKCLVSEVLADVYHMTIKELMRKCENNQFLQRDIERVYNVIPDIGEVTSNWNLITEPLARCLLATPFLFTSKDGGRWILPSQAVFSILDGSTNLAVEKSVLKIAKHYGINFVEAPKHIISMLKCHGLTVKTLSKDFIVNCLKNDNSYESFPFNDKMNILIYLVNDGNYSRLQGLKLLPLHNGSFVDFGGANRIYVCREEADLFPGQEASFINQTLQEDVYTIIISIARKGNFQMSALEAQPADVIASLVARTLDIQNGSPSSTTMDWDRTGPIGETWLRKVWLFIQRFSLSSFSELHLIPDFMNNVLYKVSQKFLMRSCEGHSISKNISNCLRYLSIAVLDEVTEEIKQHRDIRRYVLIPTSNNVLSLIALVQSRNSTQQIQTFNSSVTQPERDEFIVYLTKCSLSTPVKQLIFCMNLYLEKKSRRPVSVKDINRVVKTGTIPIHYFRESLSCPTSDHESLATLFSVPVIQEEDAIIDILNNLWSKYEQAEVITMMHHVLLSLPYYHKKDTIMSIARCIQFVTSTGGQLKRADELYDPEDEILQSVIVDQNKFPKTPTRIEIDLLRKVGLKSWNEISAEDILQCARNIQSSTIDHLSQRRSKTLIDLLLKKPNLLQTYINNSTLAMVLKNTRFVVPKARSESYPKCLPWFEEELSFCCPSDMFETKHTSLVGSIKPILQEPISGLSRQLGCNQVPSSLDVINQLQIIVEKYKDKFKPDLLPMISTIYRFLANKPHSDCQRLKGHKWLWTGNGFDEPGKVYLMTKSSDINLLPYLYPLPSEFSEVNLQSFFGAMGSKKEQNPKLLIDVQMSIREKYKESGTSLNEAKSDLHLVISILNHLKDRPKNEIEGVLVPIKQEDATKVVLYPVNECNYCRDDDELYGDEKHFVHQDITPDTAEKLGVPTVMDTLFENAERLEEWGQSEPLTRRIKNLLESYKDGLSVPKEIIQNADDAGATKVCFMYDERDKDTYGRKLIDKNMLECQGPALWAYNDAVFTDDDLHNITKVSGATKQEDLSKIGKFGLGFCSVYNLTDVPSFVTGNNMVIFDPHYEYLSDVLKSSKQPGLRVDFTKNRKILERKTSQFQPFNGIFGCDLRTNQSKILFNGSLFRLPLRTKLQAASSEISGVTYDREQVNSLLNIFVEAGGNLLLFTQNVSCIEFYHLPCDETNPENAALIFSVSREIKQCIERPLSSSSDKKRCLVLKELAENLAILKNGQSQVLSKINLTLILEVSVRAEKGLSEFNITDASSSTTTWIVAWASGTERSKTLALQSNRNGLLPLASVACPLSRTNDNAYKTCSLNSLPFGYYKRSHVFCFLPLPVQIDLPVFLNGSFAVSSDRRRLSCKTTDDKNSFGGEWNEALMTDAVCNAYVLFLQRFNDLDVDPSEPYHKMWPTHCGQNGNFGNFQKAFYQSVTGKNCNVEIFRRYDKNGSFKKCKFLDTEILETEFGDEAFGVCVQCIDDNESLMIKLPRHVLDCFIHAGCEKEITEKTFHKIDFYKKLVFPNLESDIWNDRMIDSLMLHALENTSEEMQELLKKHRCIPTHPKRLLRRPGELVERNSSISGLFCTEDERFILPEPSKYSKISIISTLCNLGMNSISLPNELLLDRARSIAFVSQTCSKCSLDRCSVFIKYIRNNIGEIEKDPDVVSSLKSIQFLPVAPKPINWKWPWGGDSVECNLRSHTVDYKCRNENHTHDKNARYERSTDLYTSQIIELVCVSKPVLDIKTLDNRVRNSLGIIVDVTPSFIFENLLKLCKHASESEELLDNIQMLKKTIHTMYTYLSDEFIRFSFEAKRKKIMQAMAKGYWDQNIIFLNGAFVKPSQVVMESIEDCSPHFYCLQSAFEYKAFKGFLCLLQIEEKCSTSRVLSALKKYQHRSLDDVEIQLYVKLLRVLVEALQRDRESDKDLGDVLVPDTQGKLRSINTLCFDEPNVNSTGDMHFTHGSIPPDIAMGLGIRTKREQKIRVCSRDLHLDAHSQDFGQHEELTSRLQRIISGYPCDGSILKELVQNADDAQATEVHIVIDWNYYPTDRLFHESWKPLQGPAILVYNDKSFAKEDITGIQSLGVGSKSNDPTKTGQYGVGFNAVYHLTDVPSFLTRGQEVETNECLCVLDPHCAYVPQTTRKSPGKLYFDTAILQEDYGDVFSCYHSDLLMTKNRGTIFRLPLRTITDAMRSRISKTVITKELVEKLIEDLKAEMMDVLLFLSNVTSIKVSEICEGELREIYSVKLQNENNLEEYKKEVANCSATLRQNGDLREFCPYEISYKTIVKDCNGKCSEWLIVRRIGFSGQIKCPENILRAYQNKDLGLLPRGGVAFPLTEPKPNTMCKARRRLFCFLPLPLDTGLPVHCNGHFALDHEARRNLWTDENDGYKSSWNKFLFEDIIAPAYTSALIKMKDHLDLNRRIFELESILQTAVSRLFDYFPDVSNTQNEYFKYLSCSIYRCICYQEAKVFPSLKTSEHAKIKVTFYALKDSCMTFPPVLNTLKPTKTNMSMVETVMSFGKNVLSTIHKLTHSLDEKPQLLVNLMQELGVKLIESPRFVIKSLKEAQIEIHEISPEFFIKFLKSFNSESADKCRLHNVDVPVTETVLKSSSNVMVCLRYCLQNGTENIEDLPLCLTEDGFLRTFKKEIPVYWTKHTNIVHQSKDLFLHHDLVTLFTVATNGIKHFEIADFAKILGYSLQTEVYRTHNIPIQWDPKGKEIPNMEWIQNVWKFLNTTVNEKLSAKSPENHSVSTIQQALSTVMPWCLVPARQLKIPNVDGQYENVLFPVGNLQYILDINTCKGTMKCALENLRLPLIDGSFHIRESTIVKPLVASETSLPSLLEFLHYYRHDIEARNLKTETCCTILEFISTHFDEVQEDSRLLSLLKDLPIHLSINGRNTCLHASSNYLVLDKFLTLQISTAGLEEWATMSGTFLIESNITTKKLYVELGYTMEKLEAIDVYIIHLLPKFDCLPREAHLDHLNLIRDELLARPSYCSRFSGKQKKLIDILANVKFVPDVDGNLHKASNFVSPFKEVFRVFCKEHQFPCAPFRDSVWEDMLTLSGIKVKVTPNQILEFSRQVESSNTTNEDNAKKSKMLVSLILSRQGVEKEGFLKELSKIKFIVPVTVADWKREIFEQHNTKLICYSESVKEKYADFAWTTCSILPKYADPDSCSPFWNQNEKSIQVIKNQLGMYSDPPMEKVVRHVQNISDALKIAADKASLHNIYSLKGLMTKIYKWLHGQHDQDIFRFKECLAVKPILFLPESKLFVTCDRCVKNFDRCESEIKPYLMKIPDEYVEYSKLFKMLGMDVDTNVCTYVRVLRNLKIDVGNSELHINEIKQVQVAVQRLLDLLFTAKPHEIDTLRILNLNKLYFLARTSTLEDASGLVYSDNDDYEQTIGHDISKPYLMDFKTLNVWIPGIISERLKKLPQQMQPIILSEMISKELDQSQLTMIRDGKGTQLKAFISSPYFKEALVRIYVHSHKKSPNYTSSTELSEQGIEIFLAGLEKLMIVQVEKIVIRLLFENKEVGRSEKNCHFLQHSCHEYLLYCVFDDDDDLTRWLVDNQQRFVVALKACTNGEFIDPDNLLSKVLTRYNRPEDISRALDKEEIKQYNIGFPGNESVFPPAGTVVHPNRHCYLSSNFYDYDVGEYVALLICEETSVGEKFIPAEYIYAIVEKKIETNADTPFIGKTLIEYELLVGDNKLEQRKAYDLFKFKRNFEHRTQELQVFLDIPESKDDDRPLDEILKDIRDRIEAAWTRPEDERRKIIKRLFKTWHPDKNIGKEELATEIFKFIKLCVLKMERGDDIDITTDTPNSDANNTDYFFQRAKTQSTFWSHFEHWERSTRNDSFYSRENATEGSQMRGNRRQTAHEKVPSIHEACQWMRQAKMDYTAAQEFLPQAYTGPHFNWICFMFCKCVEKVLKALHLSINCNNVPNKTTNLVQLSNGLDANLRAMVRRLVDVVGPCDRAMYPERLRIPEIPADIYTKQMTETARDISKNILDFADDQL